MIRKYNGKLLKDSGMLAKHADCCCGSCTFCDATAGGNTCVEFTVPVTVDTTSCCLFRALEPIWIKVFDFPTTLTLTACPTSEGNGCIFSHLYYHPDYVPAATLGENESYFDPLDYDIRLYADDTCTTPYEDLPTTGDEILIGIQVVLQGGGYLFDLVSINLIFNNLDGTGQEYVWNILSCYMSDMPGCCMEITEWTYNTSTCCYSYDFDFSTCTYQTATLDFSYWDEPCTYNEELDLYECTYYEDIRTYCLMPIRPDGVATICSIPQEI